MAQQICFYVDSNNEVKEKIIEYKYYAGFALCQKRKCINSLHEQIKNEIDLPVLEISSRSEVDLGVKLSAFNLTTEFRFKKIPVECIYQGSKVFENGQVYHDIYDKTPLEAKKDERIKNSGNVMKYNVFGLDIYKSFNLKPEDVPKTAFYDYIWIYGVACNPELMTELVKYSAFTDTAFNMKKSINCQARSAALLVSLNRKGIIPGTFMTFDKFCKLDFYKESLEYENNK